MRFWQAQAEARKRTALYVICFVGLTLIVAAALEWVLWATASPTQEAYFPYFGLIFLGVTFGVAGFYYALYRSHGGAGVAESLGGQRVDATTSDLRLQQLVNIVHEMAIAASVPVPAIYVLPADEINAFAAGMRTDRAAIAVTRGAILKLSRDELQGVVAHEFGHVKSGDMRLSMRLAAMIMGFFIVFYLGLRMFEIGLLTRGGSRQKGGSPAVLIALAFLVAGAVTWFFGALLRSMVSRQREYLADASAVQFTRNPAGIAGALRKIAAQQRHDMPKRGLGYAHMYFSHQSVMGRLFATHPPIEKRIAAIEGRTYLTDDLEFKGRG